MVGREGAMNRLEQARSTPSGFGKGGRFGIRTTEHASWPRLKAQKGIAYMIAVDGYNGASGAVTLSW